MLQECLDLLYEDSIVCSCSAPQLLFGLAFLQKCFNNFPAMLRVLLTARAFDHKRSVETSVLCEVLAAAVAQEFFDESESATLNLLQRKAEAQEILDERQIDVIV